MNTPVVRRLISTTPTAAVRPVLGTGVGEGIRRFNILRALLHKNQLYAVWAEPIPDIGVIRWHTELSGEIEPYSSLMPEVQEKARRVLRYYVDAAYALITQQPDADDLRPILDDSFEVPSLDGLYLVGKRPVLVQWGYLYSDVNPPRGLIKKLTRGLDPPRLMVNVKVVQAGSQAPILDAAVRLTYETDTHVLTTNADGNVSFHDIRPFDYPCFQLETEAPDYRAAVSTLRLDRTIGELVWSGLTPLITTMTLQPVITQTNVRVLVANRQTGQPVADAIVTLSTKHAEQTATTGQMGEALFRAVPIRDGESAVAYATHPAYADERLELEAGADHIHLLLDPGGLRGRRGAFSVNLRWNTIDDLDLIVTDPSGNQIFYGNRTADVGGHMGILDLDANADDANLTDQPQENIYWEMPHPGAYRIDVHLFRRRTTPNTDIAYEVTVLEGNDRLVLPGRIRIQNERQIVTIIEL